MAQSLLEALAASGVTTIDNQTVLAVQNLLESQHFQETLPDDEDIFQCGRCKREFTSLAAFLNHKQTQCMTISREAVNKTQIDGSIASADGTVIASNGGQSFIYTTQFAQPSLKQSGAYMLPVHSYAQNVVLPDEMLAFQDVEHSLHQSNGQMASSISSNETFLSQVGTFLGDRNLTSLSAPNRSSTYCSFLSPTSSYSVDDNGCLISTNINHSIGTYPVGSGTVAGATQRVILMQQPPTAVTQLQINAVESLDTSGANEQFVVVNAAISTQNVAPIEESTSETTSTSRRRKTKAASSSEPSDSPATALSKSTALSTGNVLKCKYCEKTFTKNFDMLQHVRSHTGEKPFQCIVCGRGFAQKSNVKKHLQTHKVWPQGLTNTLPDRVTVVEDITAHVQQQELVAKSNSITSGTSIEQIEEAFNNISSAAADSQSANESSDTNSFHIIVENGASNDQPVKAIISVRKSVGSEMTAVDVVSSTDQEPKTPTDARHLKLIIDNSYVCQYCQSKFTTYFHYKSHMVIHKDEQVYKCVVKTCNESFRELEVFLDHIKLHQDELSYRCHQCNEQFMSLNELANHQYYSHAPFPKQGPKPGPKYFQCMKCNSKYASPEALQHHIGTVSHDYHCLQPNCPKVFTCERYLRRHLVTHGAFDDYICSVCNKPFKTEQYLKTHMLIHSNEKPFQCNTCKKAFNRKDKLKRHMVIHEPVKRYKCPLLCHTGCTKAFNRPDKLKAHLLSHSGAKPFRCKICDRVFTRRAHLQEHERTHANEFKFSCKFCKKGFQRRKLFQIHHCNSVRSAGSTEQVQNEDVAKRRVGRPRKTIADSLGVSGEEALSPRRGRPPKKAANHTASSDDRRVATVSVSKEFIKSEPVPTTSTDELVSNLTRSHSLPVGDVVNCDPLSTEQAVVVGSGNDTRTVTLGHLDSSAGTVYLFHPLVDDSGQRIAFQTFKLYDQSDMEADNALLGGASANDVISGASDLATLLNSSMLTGEHSGTPNNENACHREQLITQNNEVMSGSLS